MTCIVVVTTIDISYNFGHKQTLVIYTQSGNVVIQFFFGQRTLAKRTLVPSNWQGGFKLSDAKYIVRCISIKQYQSYSNWVTAMSGNRQSGTGTTLGPDGSENAWT